MAQNKEHWVDVFKRVYVKGLQNLVKYGRISINDARRQLNEIDSWEEEELC
jgi:hypothetical protein